MSEIEQQLAAAHEALTAGAWIIARDSFRAALDEEESPEAFGGLANAPWWLGDVGEAVAHRERSHAGFRLCFYHPTRGRLSSFGRRGSHDFE